ncbi:MAG: pyridoxamine 5'-phosphate oxidase [Phycisphaeraceae bacterium]
MSIDAMRRDYGGTTLLEADVDPNPTIQFRTWFRQACDGEIYEPNAMTLATVGRDGKPDSRIVLLKGIDDRGLTFFTNLTSTKAHDIAVNPHVSLTFYWDRLHRQVRITGDASLLPRDESEAYFHTRPRGSQLGAWVSAQSRIISDRSELETAYANAEESFTDKEIPLPDHWGGYLVTPSLFEFWQGRTSRLHDRLRYRLSDDLWLIERLAP